MNFYSLLAIGIGATLGAWLRWLLGSLLNQWFPTVPLGTLSANLIGGLLIGMTLGAMSYFEALPIELRLFITTGFLGGLTTFSTFSAETTTLLLRQQYSWTLVIISLHLFGSLMLTLLGFFGVKLLLRG